MFFLTPRYLKQGRQFAKDARKLVAYKRDIASPDAIAEVENEIAALELAVKSRNQEAVVRQAEILDKACGKIVKPSDHSSLAENIEVFLVAIVVALGVRTYFLQPFTIPTGSMQPTLNGIIFHSTKETAPNPLTRIFQSAVFGRHYVNFVAQEREQISNAREIKSPVPFVSRVPGFGGGIFSRTELETVSESGKHRTYIIKEAMETVNSQILRNLERGKVYEPGETIVRGYFDAGDHVFVDKISYNFRTPHRGETFVFSTAGISAITPPGKPSQYYIKRLVGLPGDTLQVRPPELFINDQKATERGIQRVMSGTETEPSKDGYRGYGNGVEQKGYDQQVYVHELTYLNSPDATFTLPQQEYFAMGDNSFNSWDSRGWGTVPERNIMGRALVVYWPFWPHFGPTN